MQRSTYLKGAALAALLTAGCAGLASSASADVVIAGYAPGWDTAYTPGPYYDYGYYDRGPIGLGADIATGAVDLGVGIATAPFAWADEDAGYYRPAYGYNTYGYGYPAYAADYYDRADTGMAPGQRPIRHVMPKSYARHAQIDQRVGKHAVAPQARQARQDMR